MYLPKCICMQECIFSFWFELTNVLQFIILLGFVTAQQRNCITLIHAVVVSIWYWQICLCSAYVVICCFFIILRNCNQERSDSQQDAWLYWKIHVYNQNVSFRWGMYCEHRLQYWNFWFVVDVVVTFLSQEIFDFLLFF